ncbi:hypothetical protein [Qipengyuania sp.]|uniref:hypothetical protein n=1 Tax=Qipengyuania sp. TaxID=2004515 RepID=UPI003AF53C7A
MRLFACVILAIVPLVCAEQANAGSADVAVPQAPPRPTIQGVKYELPEVAGENEITLSSWPDSRPRSLEDAVDVLRRSLPKDYLQSLMVHTGYRRGYAIKEITSERTDLRIADLGDFLFEEWAFPEEPDRLSREFNCISFGERDITVFLQLLVTEEWDEARTDDNAGWYLTDESKGLGYSASISALAARSACEELSAIAD